MNTHILTVQKIEPEKRDQKPAAIEETFMDIHGGDDKGTVQVGGVATWSVKLSDQEVSEYTNPDTAPSNLIAVEENVLDSVAEEVQVNVVDPETLNGVPEMKELAFHGTRAKLDWLQENPSGIVKNPVVAVLDTGADAAFPLMSLVEKGASWVSGEPWNQTTHFHGVHVAGLAHRHGIGMKFLIGKVLGNNGSGSRDGIVASIYWAVDNGADIINLSLGGPANGDTVAYSNAIKYANDRNVNVWVAMGNTGQREKRYPAAIEGAKAVIALLNNTAKADFSTYGEWAFTSARGVQMLSYGTGGRLVRASGTSMATPYVAGEDALLVARFGKNALRTKAFLENGVRLSIPADQQGRAGRISIHKASNFLEGASLKPIPPTSLKGWAVQLGFYTDKDKADKALEEARQTYPTAFLAAKVIEA